ncbi:AAA family ATPase [Thalassotalea mangrovi]|uniref:MoxR family ATPase n=1 Tax=Thalassotalea mangrovi TaxID=2572245 RepID=A0A4U1B7W6_9GAMM|nr:MoxR family ATPase [Thalassotalea mangrovi]TKB46599.1 MoxR family ATPase [Thalassotalea mangrovi]
MTATAELEQQQRKLAQQGYIADRQLCASLLLMQRIGRPLLLEGDAGVGKTEIASALARSEGCELIRLQCYEGLDINAAVYEWNYQHQLLSIKLIEQSHLKASAKHPKESPEEHIFSRKYLLERPLLAAISRPEPPVLLIDEIDRADEEFEAFLLELLADFQISIPELGTIKATSIPLVILTSNGTRELSDALRRRCLYHYVDYPPFDKELLIIQAKVPDISQQLARQVVAFVQDIRKKSLRKIPGIAETLDWAVALMALDIDKLDQNPEAIRDSLVCLLKTREDMEAFSDVDLQRLIATSL